MSTSYDPRSARIERYRGDTYAEVFTVRDADGNAVDLTGATVKFTVKESPHDGQDEAVLAKSSANPSEIGITGASQGEFTVKFISSQMQALSPKRYAYDAEVTLSDGSVHTVACNVFEILPDVTTPL